MASLTRTFQGDLTASISSYLYNEAVRAADDAAIERELANDYIRAVNVGDTMFAKSVNPNAYNPAQEGVAGGPVASIDQFSPNFRRGEFFGAALAHRLAPNPLGLLGKRFQKEPFSYTGYMRGQSTPLTLATPPGGIGPRPEFGLKTPGYVQPAPRTSIFDKSSPINPIPTGVAVTAQTKAKRAGQPFPQIAVGSSALQRQPSPFLGSSYASGMPGMWNTSPDTKAVKVKDPKLGKFFTAVSRSLNVSLSSMSEQVDENEATLITVRESLLGTIKKLEVNSDTLEAKLDAIIDVLRDQNRNAIVSEDNKESERKEAQIELQKQQYEGEVIQKVGEDDLEFALRDARDEAQDGDPFGPYPSDTGDLWKDTPQMARGGIVDGPQSGYPAILHGKEAVIPIDTPFTRQSYASGTLGRGSTTINNSILSDSGSAPSFDKFVPNMFKQVIESKISDVPNLKETTEMLGKAVELPVKASGLIAFNVLGKALSGMKTLAGDVSGPLKTVLSPLTSFGVSNTLINGLTRDLSVGGAAVRRRDANKSFGAEIKNNNMMTRFFNGIMNLFNREPDPEPPSNGNGEGGYSGGGYRGGGMQYVGGGPGNFIEGAKNWWNRGRNVRVPNENNARWFGRNSLMADDARQITRSNKAFKSGAGGIRGWRPFKAFSPDMVRTGPTPAVRQAFERPVRAITSLFGTVKALKNGSVLGLILSDIMKGHGMTEEEWMNGPGTVTHYERNFNRTNTKDQLTNFVNLNSFEQQANKVTNYEQQKTKVIEINNKGVTALDSAEQDMNLIGNNPNPSLHHFFPSPYNY